MPECIDLIHTHKLGRHNSQHYEVMPGCRGCFPRSNTIYSVICRTNCKAKWRKWRCANLLLAYYAKICFFFCKIMYIVKVMTATCLKLNRVYSKFSAYPHSVPVIFSKQWRLQRKRDLFFIFCSIYLGQKCQLYYFYF